MTDRIAQMAANNAAWINMAVSALGISGEFTPVLWQNVNDMPPIFPNADTLGGTIAQKMSAIEQLVETRSGRVVAIKDSWAELDLSPLGFDILFEAHWLYRHPHPLPIPQSDLDIEPITTADRLHDFALACNGPDIPTEVYSPSLLNTPEITWLAGQKDRQIIAGVTAVKAEGLNGINNYFGESDLHKQHIIAAAINVFPDLPASTYTRTSSVPLFLDLGFETVGNLRIWLRPIHA